MHNEKLGRSVNIVNMILKFAHDYFLEKHPGGTGQRGWDDSIDQLNKWTRMWGSRFPTFPVPTHPRPHAPHTHTTCACTCACARACA